MLSVHYFASIREAAGRSDEQLELPADIKDVQGLMAFLARRDPGSLSTLGADGRVLVAVNQEVVDRDHPLRGDEEVAFFPPVTGG